MNGTISATHIIELNTATVNRVKSLLAANPHMKLLGIHRISSNRHTVAISGEKELVLKMVDASTVEEYEEKRFPTNEQKRKLSAMGVSWSGMNKAAATHFLEVIAKNGFHGDSKR